MLKRTLQSEKRDAGRESGERNLAIAEPAGTGAYPRGHGRGAYAMNFRSRTRLVLLSALAFVLAGCVPIPIPHGKPPVVYGGAIAEEVNRATVLPGQKHEEVIQRVGAPAFNFGAGRAYVYPWTIDQGDVVFLAPGVGMLGGVGWAKAQLFIVAFDDDGRSVKSGTAEVPLFRSVSSEVRRWMVAQGLAELARPQPEGNSSTIVVFRRANPPCDWRQHAIDPWSPFQSPFAPAVAVDGQVVGDVLKGEFINLVVAPGVHHLTVEAVPPFRQFESEGMRSGRGDAASLTVHVGPGQATYAETWICLRAHETNTRYLAHLESRDSEQALPELAGLKSAWP